MVKYNKKVNDDNKKMERVCCSTKYVTHNVCGSRAEVSVLNRALQFWAEINQFNLIYLYFYDPL
jgi:hypothetical protein